MTRIQNRMETTARGDGRNITDGANARGSSFGKKTRRQRHPYVTAEMSTTKKNPKYYRPKYDGSQILWAIFLL